MKFVTGYKAKSKLHRNTSHRNMHMYQVVLHCNISYINKPGTPAAGQCAPGFLKLLLFMMSVCMHVCVFECVSATEAVNN